MNKIKIIAYVCAGLFLPNLSTQAAVLLSTDFTGRTVNTATASNITWTTLGLADPGDMTTSVSSLFDTTDAQGFFVPASNIGNGDSWNTSLTLNLIDNNLQLDTISLHTRNFNNSGVFQPVDKDAAYRITITGSTSGQIYNTTLRTPISTGASDEILEFNLGSLLLNDSEIYTLGIRASNGLTTGTNNGLNALEIEGSIIPEPSSFLFLGTSSLTLLLRRRKHS